MFNPKSKKCINIALDLGIFGDKGFSKGIEDLKEAMPAILQGKPDVIQVNPGGLKIFNSLKNKANVSIALRLDVTNVYEPRDIQYAWDTMDLSTMEFANDSRVACVVLNLLNLDENSRLQEQCIQNIQIVAARCKKLGIPLMVEPLVMTAKPGAGSASIGDVNKIAALVRQAVELGPGGHVDHTQVRRHRPGVGDLQAACGTDGWTNRCEQRVRQRLGILVHGPACGAGRGDSRVSRAGVPCGRSGSVGRSRREQ